MQDMLDNENVINQRDPFGALGAALGEWQLLTETYVLEGDVEPREFANVVIAGMGGSALAGDLLQDWLDLSVPLAVVKEYDLPGYVGKNTLVIASSTSGNTEETISALHQGIEKGATVAVVAAGGKLFDIAVEKGLVRVKQPQYLQPRMGTFGGVMSMLTILEAFGVVEGKKEEFASGAEWLKDESRHWAPSVPTEHNLAKQLAIFAAGKTPLVFAASSLQSLAYKWKISFNESSKNVSYYNVLPEFNHNEFMGWTSHPVEKPFAVFDLRSNFEHPRVSKRFEITDRMLSGKRPKAQVVGLQGDSLLHEIFWGAVLADMTSIYLGILNGVEPSQVDLITKFKQELN